ncbi:MAG: hypothetical protein V4489_05155 [Chlamydiota bacterium]
MNLTVDFNGILPVEHRMPPKNSRNEPARMSVITDRSVNILGSTNFLSYDSDLEGEDGYYLCKNCQHSFFAMTAEPVHKPNCSLEKEDRLKFSGLIYVIGSNESWKCTPFEKSKIEEIQKIAKEEFSQWK